MKYTIYLRTNQINKKQYVGQTNNFQSRENYWRTGRNYANKIINCDRKKYGLENWTVEVIDEAETREEAWELEQKYITELNTIWPNGYNLSNGGKGDKGGHHSPKTEYKINDERLSKPVKQYDLEGHFIRMWPSAAEAERQMGYDATHINSCCRGERKTHSKCIWKLAYPEEKSIQEYKNNQSKSFDLNDLFH